MTGAWLVMIIYAWVIIVIETAVWWDKIGHRWQGIKTGIMNTVKWVCWTGACMGLGFAIQQTWAIRKDLMYQFRAWLQSTENRLARAAGPTRAERRAADLKRKIDWLEHISDQWNELRMAGRAPMWTDVFGWIDDVSVCPCGYVRECAIWCGDGSCHGEVTAERLDVHTGAVIGPREYVFSPKAFGGVTAKEFSESFHALAKVLGPDKDGS